MKKLILTLLLATPLFSLAQTNILQSFDDLRENINLYKYIQALDTLETKENVYLSVQGALPYYAQAKATALSMNCGNMDSILYYNFVGLTGRYPKIDPTQELLDTIDISGYEIQSAREHIISEAAHRKVLMINEAHSTTYHRLFVKSLLKDLYAQGYRVLALEALNYTKDPYTSLKHAADSGYYTKEPLFGDMIREALELGYKLYGYEPQMAQYAHSGNRDSLMAVNLESVERESNGEKIIVYAGHGHISKKSPRSMYTYFKALSESEPLVVSQTRYAQMVLPGYEKPLYRTLCNKASPEGLPLSFSEKTDGADSDIYVIHPRVSYLDGRPEYLISVGNRKLKKVKAQTPTVFMVYIKDEYQKYGTQIVPFDIVAAQKAGEYYVTLPKDKKYIIIKEN